MTLTYPLNLGADADFISFAHFKYKSNQKQNYEQQELTGLKKKEFRGYLPPTGTTSRIRLYMPESTPDIQNNNNWEGKSFEGPLGLMLSGISRAAIGGGTSAALQAANNSVGAAQQWWADQAAKVSSISAGQLTALQKGKVYNPNIELLYSAPAIRAFSFQFRFVASTAEENAMIRSIILEFKKYSAPRNMGDMFQVPEIWSINYRNPDMMGKFKPAALKTVSVQANPSTAYHTTHDDFAPVEYGLGLAFQETNIITQEDHASGIGY